MILEYIYLINGHTKYGFFRSYTIHKYMRFKDWLNEGFSTGCKLGLYAPIDDALGQYPPLYGMARSPDLITYIDIMYKGKGPSSKNGIVKYHDKDPRITNVKNK